MNNPPTAQPGDYLDLYEASRAAYPDVTIEDARFLAGYLAHGVTMRAKTRGIRSSFGDLSALEAAHKLAQFICRLPAYDQARVAAWLEAQ